LLLIYLKQFNLTLFTLKINFILFDLDLIRHQHREYRLENRLNLGGPISDRKKVLRVDGMTLDGVNRSVVCLERRRDFL